MLYDLSQRKKYALLKCQIAIQIAFAQLSTQQVPNALY